MTDYIDLYFFTLSKSSVWQSSEIWRVTFYRILGTHVDPYWGVSIKKFSQPSHQCNFLYLGWSSSHLGCQYNPQDFPANTGHKKNVSWMVKNPTNRPKTFLKCFFFMSGVCWEMAIIFYLSRTKWRKNIIDSQLLDVAFVICAIFSKINLRWISTSHSGSFFCGSRLWH